MFILDFQSRLAFEDHVNLHKVNKESYICACGFETHDHFDLLTHLAESDTCTMDSSTWPDYANKYKKRYNVKPFDGNFPMFKCYDCDSAFQNLKSLAEHVTTSHKEKYIVCEHGNCGKKYSTASAYRRHVKEKHIKEMKCTFCNEILTKYEADHHICERPKESLESCPICLKDFSITEAIKHFEDPAHRLVEENFILDWIPEKKLPCCICEENINNFKDILSLLIHGENVHGTKPLVALIRSIRDIREGKRIEFDGEISWFKSEFNWDEDCENPELITCRFCGVQTVKSGNYIKKHFATQSSLHNDQTKKWMNHHVLEHIPCPKCNISTIKEVWEGLDHYERVHKSNPIEFYDFIGEYRKALTVPDKMYDCIFCGTVFNANHIRSHFDYKNVSHNVNFRKWKQHTKNSCFPCKYCDKRKMSSLLQALDHYEQDHKIPAINCYNDYCDMIDETLKNNRKECYLCQEKFPTIWVDLPYHFQKKAHLVHYKQWQIKNYMHYFPCSDCDIQGLITMNDAMSHYVQKHKLSEDKYYDYFILFSEELRANTLEPDDSKNRKGFLPMRDGKVAIPRLKRKEEPQKIRIEPMSKEKNKRSIKDGKLEKVKKLKKS